MRCRRLLSKTLLNFVSGRSVTMGAPTALSDLTGASRVADVALLQPTEVCWLTIDVVGRRRLSQLVATASQAVPLTDIASAVASKPPTTPETNGKHLFATKDFRSLQELVTFYETVVYHARAAKREWDALELQSFHIKDDLKRGLSAFKQAHLDKEKVRLGVVKKKMEEQQANIAKIGADNFTTAICNDIVNALRIAGETHEHARVMALRVLDDMTLLRIPFDDVTQLLLKRVAFGDGPLEDSGLLFSCVEYPERGEVSVGGNNQTLEQAADAALSTISARHQTPLDGSSPLRQGDTYPLLQRSPE